MIDQGALKEPEDFFPKESLTLFWMLRREDCGFITSGGFPIWPEQWLGLIVLKAYSSRSCSLRGSIFLQPSRSTFGIRYIGSEWQMVSEECRYSSISWSLLQLIELTAWVVFMKQVIPRQRITLRKSLEAGLSFCIFFSLIYSIFFLKSLLIFSISLIYSFFLSLDFCADIRFLFFFLVSWDSSSKTMEERAFSSAFISSSSMSYSDFSLMEFLSLAFCLLRVNLCLLTSFISLSLADFDRS